MTGAAAVIDHAAHTAYSDPGRHGPLLDPLPTEPDDLSAVARNVIVHYRASGHELPEATRHEVNSRWVARLLDADQARHPFPLDVPRQPTERVQGCCRDHTLLCIAALRQHGVPARSRVGYAGYFVEGWHHDHVIAEAWIDGRWRRFDSEVDMARPALTQPMDLDFDAPGGTGFVTAAAAWLAYRRGRLDADTHGVDPSLPLFSGPRFLFDEVIYEVAHRFGDELLLWDGWGRIGVPGTPVDADEAAWIDAVAELLVAADDGDLAAEQRLYEQYLADDGLRPGPVVYQASPFDDPIEAVDLAAVRAE